LNNDSNASDDSSSSSSSSSAETVAVVAQQQQQEQQQEPEEDSWIGWHNDSGFLTALAGDIYVNETTGEILGEAPDKEAGLYVANRNRSGKSSSSSASSSPSSIHVSIPADCMGVQLGECVQIITGGALVATPHCVKGSKVKNVGRAALACFIDCKPTFALDMPKGSTREQVLGGGVEEREGSKVPPLGDRWQNGQTFGDFLGTTFSKYYEWSNDSSN
jgi:isopenicillin N synthase-like dioxygenase